MTGIERDLYRWTKEGLDTFQAIAAHLEKIADELKRANDRIEAEKAHAEWLADAKADRRDF